MSLIQHKDTKATKKIRRPTEMRRKSARNGLLLLGALFVGLIVSSYVGSYRACSALRNLRWACYYGEWERVPGFFCDRFQLDGVWYDRDSEFFQKWREGPRATPEEITGDPFVPYVDPFRPWIRYVHSDSIRRCHSGSLVRMRWVWFRWKVDAGLDGCDCENHRVRNCWDRCFAMPGWWP
jgi:hypothetical protein